MATKEQLFEVLATNEDGLTSHEIAEKIGETYKNFQTQLDRFEKKKFIKKDSDKRYTLTDAGKEEFDKMVEEAESELPGEVSEGEQSEESVGSTEFQQFKQLGKMTGVPTNLLSQTALHIWNGGDYTDLKWVAEGMRQMGIRPDLSRRWFHSWRSYLVRTQPNDVKGEVPPEMVAVSNAKTETKESPKAVGVGERAYILDTDNYPLFVGKGLGDLDYQDALALSTVRTARARESGKSSGSAESSVKDVLAIVEAVRNMGGEAASGKSYVVRPSADGQMVVEEIEQGRPVIISQGNAGGQKARPGYLVNQDGSISDIEDGKPVVILRDKQDTNPRGTQYLVDQRTGEIREVQPGQPIIIKTESAPQNNFGVTPVQFKDKEGNLMTLDLATYFKLEDHKEETRRAEESHKNKMEIAHGFKELLAMGGRALERMSEEGDK